MLLEENTFLLIKDNTLMIISIHGHDITVKNAQIFHFNFGLSSTIDQEFKIAIL